MGKKEDALKRLRDRVKLQALGIVVPQGGNRPVVHPQTVGGPGPRGKQYYITYSEDEPGDLIASLPVYPEDHYFAKYAIPTRRSENNRHILTTEDGVFLKGVISPLKNTGQNMLMAEFHCYNTLLLCVYLKCVHYDDEEGCKFCTIDVAEKNWNRPERATNEQLIEDAKIGSKCGARSFTITGGTPSTSDRDQLVREFIELVPKLQQQIPNSTYCVHFEPIKDCSLYKELSKYVDTIGMFLEVLDEDLRKKICPGKAKISKEEYIRNFKELVKYFGRDKVYTNCIVGLGEDYDVTLKAIEELAKLGVKTKLAPLRTGSKELGENCIPSYIGKIDELVDLHIEVGKILHKYDVDWKLGSAGCVGCGGCSAMIEVSNYIKLLD